MSDERICLEDCLGPKSYMITVGVVGGHDEGEDEGW